MMVLVLIAGYAYIPVSVRRYIPRRQREFRRWELDTVEMSVYLQTQKKYCLSLESLNVRLIALKRVEERRIETTHSLEQQGIPYEVFEAFDGLAGFNQDVVEKYAGTKRLSRLKTFSEKSYDEALKLYLEKRDVLDGLTKESLHESLRFGCFLSHVTLWEQMLDFKQPLMVILEDDVVVVPNFIGRLYTVLKSMPANWDLLYLNGCYKKFGPLFAPGVKLSSGGLCTSGYAISLAAVGKLSDSLEKSDKPIDHILDENVLLGHLFAFHADPPLVQLLPSLESTLAY
jgi:GR25 family glycosyltransferase involved in LPS biosynthesis